jgi:hypothetical protein
MIYFVQATSLLENWCKQITNCSGLGAFLLNNPNQHMCNQLRKDILVQIQDILPES